MAFVDESVVNVALPKIESNLHTTLGAMQWVVNAYTLCMSALLLVALRPLSALSAAPQPPPPRSMTVRDTGGVCQDGRVRATVVGRSRLGEPLPHHEVIIRLEKLHRRHF